MISNPDFDFPFFFFILNFKTVYILIAEGYLLPVVFNLL